MTINLSKGGNINLSKHAPSMTNALVGLGWDARSTDGKEFDLDASVIMCGKDGKALSDPHFIFYGNPTAPDGSVEHRGDNRTGEGDGDDEQVLVHLAKLPAEVEKIVVVVSIYEAEERGQNFGQVSNAYVRVVDADNELGGEEVRYDLSEDSSTERSMIFAEVYRNGSDWKFRAVEQGYSEGLAAVIRDFGLMAS